MFSFVLQEKALRDVMVDQKLAAFGDAYVNFLYSLALSIRKGEPTGKKVNNRLLAEAVRSAGLRKLLPSKIDRHKQADAAEALIAYVWTRGLMTLEESVGILKRNESMVDAFCSLLLTAKNKLERKNCF
jgi:hypothetical protein